MKNNIIFSLLGVVLGFFIGFFMANSGADAPLSADTSRSQAGGQLPPGHPDLNAGASAGSAAASSGQAQAAMDEADRNPKEFVAQIRAAALFYQLDDMRKAELYLNRALALRPDDPDANTGMGHTKYDTGDYVGAAAHYQKVLAQRPADVDVRTDLGNTYLRRNPPDYDRAIAEYRKALEVNAAHEQALAKLAEAALLKGDKATAREAVGKLAAVNPSSPALQSLRSGLDAPATGK